LLLGILMAIPSKSLPKQRDYKHFATFTIIVNDTSHFNTTTLDFQIQTHNINTGFGHYVNLIQVPLKKKVSVIQLPLENNQAYLRISQLKNGLFETDRAFNIPNGLFIVEANDNITIYLSKNPDNAIFKGHNAAKYNCVFEMGNHNDYSLDKFNRYCEQKHFIKAYEFQAYQCDSILKVKKEILARYKSLISKDVYKLMALDLQSFTDLRVLGLCRTPFVINSSDQYQAAKVVFNQRFKSRKLSDFLNQSLVLQSYMFGDFLLSLEQLSLIIRKSTVTSNYLKKHNFADIDSVLNHNYKGSLKDKLLLLSFLSVDRKRQSDFIYFLAPTIKNCKSGLYKDEIQLYADRNKIGSATYNFALQDSSGVVRQLSDFRGKIVIVDFWFTGCGGCRQMAPVLKSLAQKYKANSEVAFISICIDQGKNSWKKSIRSQLYCSGDESNLIAENGEQSEVIKYFNVTAYPTILILGKDGKLISNSPPDPRDHLDNFNKLLADNLSQE